MSEIEEAKPELTIWIDSSREADNLVADLGVAGYEIVRIMTGCEKPIVRTGMVLLSGYGDIRRMLLS